MVPHDMMQISATLQWPAFISDSFGREWAKPARKLMTNAELSSCSNWRTGIEWDVGMERAVFYAHAHACYSRRL